METSEKVVELNKPLELELELEEQPEGPKYKRYTAEEWKNKSKEARPLAERLTDDLVAKFESYMKKPKPDRVEVPLLSGVLRRVKDQVVLYDRAVLTDLTLADHEEVVNSSMHWFYRVHGVLQRRILSLHSSQHAAPVLEGEEIPKAVMSLPFVDRMALTFELRRHFISSDYPFLDECPHCKQPSIYSIDLTSMNHKPLKNAYQRRFETELPSGKAIIWSILDGNREKLLVENRPAEKEPLVARAFATRVDRLRSKGTEANPGVWEDLSKLGFMERVKKLRDSVSKADAEFFTEQYQSVEGDLDTMMDVDCVECGKRFVSAVMTHTSGFFYPSLLLEDWKKNYSSAAKSSVSALPNNEL